jgi:hypothetical protein
MNDETETETQRDDRIMGVVDEATHDLAMWTVAEHLGEPVDPVGDAAYGRLECLGSYDLARAVVLLIAESGRPARMASRMVTRMRGLRDAEVPPVEVW